MAIPCWIISFEPPTPSARQLCMELDNQGVEYTVVPAVDGRRAPPELQDPEFLGIGKSLIRHQRLLSNAELGCYLSHYRMLKRAWEVGLERVCILEDDVGLEPCFGQVLSSMTSWGSEVEFVRLMGLKVRKRRTLFPVPDCESHRLVRPERGLCGTQGYVINRPGIRKVLDTACAIGEPIDKYFDHFWETGLRQYGVEPHTIFEREHPSSIQSQRRNMKRQSLSMELRLVRLLDKLRRSLHRHFYLMMNAVEFYPASMPAERIGRTPRIKGRMKGQVH